MPWGNVWAMSIPLKAWREGTGLSRPEAARAFMVSAETIKNWESGGTITSLRVLSLLKTQTVQG